MTGNIFGQVCIPNEETVEWLYKSTRNWDNPPSKDEIREDLRDPLNHIKYLYPDVIRIENDSPRVRTKI